MTIVSGGLPLLAQEPAKTAVDARAPKAGRRIADPIRRVPYYFGQLGLSDAQRESIYSIQAKHQPRVEELEKQLEDLRAQTLKECESVLTDAQKTMLSERRAHAAQTRSRRGGAGAEAKPKS